MKKGLISPRICYNDNMKYKAGDLFKVTHIDEFSPPYLFEHPCESNKSSEGYEIKSNTIGIVLKSTAKHLECYVLVGGHKGYLSKTRMRPVK